MRLSIEYVRISRSNISIENVALSKTDVFREFRTWDGKVLV
jgi:hypothetical protein